MCTGESQALGCESRECCVSSQGWREPSTKEGLGHVCQAACSPLLLAAVLSISAGEGAWQINSPNAQKSLLPNSILQPAINAHHWLVQAKTKHTPSSTDCGIRDGKFTVL